MKPQVKQYLIVVVLIISLLSSYLWGYNGEAKPKWNNLEGETITVLVGESTVVKAPWPTIRVAVTAPDIADVRVLTPDQILLQGSKVGSTDLILWSEGEKDVWQCKVIVSMDVAGMNAILKQLFPHSSLEVSQSGEILVIKGLLRNVDHARQLHDYMDKTGMTYVDMTSVAGVQQVQLQVRIAEVSRTALRVLGINAVATDNDYFGAVTLGGSGGPLVPVSIGPEGGAIAGGGIDFIFTDDVAVPNAITLFAGFPKADFELFLQALTENQYLRLLANPTLVALSGEEASFLAGGEFPYPVVQGSGGSGTGTSITIQFKVFGIQLTFRPVVLGDGTIRLYARPEVSALSDVGSIMIGGVSVPSLITRTAETTLELKSGQTFAMAGLIKDKIDTTRTGIPGLENLPILGTLFRSVRYKEDQTELVVLVTASLVEPMSIAQVPPLPGLLHSRPDDWELYLGGRTDSIEPAKISPTDAEWLRRIGLDQLAGPGAWASYNEPIPSSQAEMGVATASFEDPKLQDSGSD